MTMSHDDDRVAWRRMGEAYNAPPETPREEMWAEIEARIGDESVQVVDLAEARLRREQTKAPQFRRVAGWAVAAAALVVMGVGIGRMTAPVETASTDAVAPGEAGTALALAAREHLGRTESLLTMVRADARDGRVDPAVAMWAEELLGQTRLLLDRPGGVEPSVREILLDLELVLAQVAALATDGQDAAQSQTEIELTLKSLDGEVMPRLQAVLPYGMAGA